MHRILAEINEVCRRIYINNYELNSDWIFTPELKTIPFRF